MKRIILLLLSLCLIISILSGCSADEKQDEIQKQEDVETTDTEATQEDVSYIEGESEESGKIDYPAYSSIEEMEKDVWKMKELAKNDPYRAKVEDYSNLAGLDWYYYPTNILDGYVLEKIYIYPDKVYISFNNENPAPDLSGVMQQYYYGFHRNYTFTLDDILDNRSSRSKKTITRDDLYDGKYLFKYNDKFIYWEDENGLLCCLQFPRYIEIMTEDIFPYCELEKLEVKQPPPEPPLEMGYPVGSIIRK